MILFHLAEACLGLQIQKPTSPAVDSGQDCVAFVQRPPALITASCLLPARLPAVAFWSDEGKTGGRGEEREGGTREGLVDEERKGKVGRGKGRCYERRKGRWDKGRTGVTRQEQV